MPLLTDHGKERIHERVGGTSGKEIKKVAGHAYRQGIKQSETKGRLQSWMHRKFKFHQKGNEMRLYHGFLYVFQNATLITAYELPHHIQDIIEENTEKEAYERYCIAFDQKEKKRERKIQERYLRRKEEFENLVLLNDLRDFAKEKAYPCEIVGVRSESGLLMIDYIPDDRVPPDLTELSSYARDVTRFTRIRLVFVKDASRKPVWKNQKRSGEDNEKVVYSTDGDLAADKSDRRLTATIDLSHIIINETDT